MFNQENPIENHSPSSEEFTLLRETVVVGDSVVLFNKKEIDEWVDETPLTVLQSATDIGLPNAVDTNLSWVFTRQEQQQLESWWQQAVHLKRGRPSRKSQAGLPTDTRTVLGASGRLRLRLTEWIERYYNMNLREFADLTGFPYNQLLYWNQGRSTPTMARFLALLNWFKEGDIRDFFQIF